MQQPTTRAPISVADGDFHKVPAVTEGALALEIGGAPTIGKFPGPRVVVGCFVVLMCTCGLSFYGLAVYLNAFSNERGWSLASISAATTVFFLVGGVGGLVTAKLLARYDVRIVMTGGALLGTVSLLALGRVTERWQLYLVYVVFAFGFSAAGLVSVTTVVTRWYVSRRTAMLAIASTGLSVGGIVLTPFAKWLVDARGLAGAAPLLALVWTIGTVPFTVWFIVGDPAARGWLPDGARVPVGHVAVTPTGVPFDEARRTLLYRGLTLAFFLVLGAQVGGLQQLVKMVEDRTTARLATFVTIASGSASVAVRLAVGRLIGTRSLVAAAVVFFGAQAIGLAATAFTTSPVPLFAAIMLFGGTTGTILMLQPLMIADRFGVRDYPRLFSRSQFVSMIGTALGPLLLGWLYDRSGGFTIPYLVAGACSLAGALILAASSTSGLRRPPVAPSGAVEGR